MTAAAQPQPTVNEQHLTAWVGERLPGSGPLEVRRIGQATGDANALFLVSRAGQRWVLRRPPVVVNAPGASDIAREWRILTALEGTAVPHPSPVLICTDADVIGAPFLIMGLVRGFTPVGVLPAPYDRAEARRSLALAMVDSLADLAAVDWRDRGLDGLGRPEGFLDRQVGRWLGQLERYRTREIKHLDAVAEWLEANRPRTGPVGLMHGDYSPFNVMASPDDPHRLAAVIDWDTGTIGDPLLDLGHLLARWTEPGEAPALSYPIDIAQRDGLPTRAALAERYAARTGFDLSALRFYETLALFKLAIILEGSVSRAFSALRPDAHRQASRVDRLIACAAQFANGERT